MNCLTHVNSILQKHYKNKSKISLEKGRSIINAFLKRHSTIFQTEADFDNHCNSIIKLINDENRANETKRKLLFLFRVVYSHRKNQDIVDKLKVEYKTISENIIKENKRNKPRNQKEADALTLSLKQLQTPINFDELHQKHLIYYLYVYIEETPRLDYRDLLYNPKNKNKTNYLVWDDVENKYQIFLNSYKTHFRYGEWNFYINFEPLNHYIKKFIEHYNIQPNTLLFIDKNQQKYKSNAFSQYFTKIFKNKTGKHITATCLRKIKENTLFHKNPKIINMSLIDKENFVIMHFRHSLNTAEIYYNKI